MSFHKLKPTSESSATTSRNDSEGSHSEDQSRTPLSGSFDQTDKSAKKSRSGTKLSSTSDAKSMFDNSMQSEVLT
jgi:hypothetical protein